MARRPEPGHEDKGGGGPKGVMFCRMQGIFCPSIRPALTRLGPVGPRPGAGCLGWEAWAGGPGPGGLGWGAWDGRPELEGLGQGVWAKGPRLGGLGWGAWAGGPGPGGLGRGA